MNPLQLIPDKLAKLLMRYMSEGLDGNITIHFAKGRIAKWDIQLVDRP